MWTGARTPGPLPSGLNSEVSSETCLPLQSIPQGIPLALPYWPPTSPSERSHYLPRPASPNMSSWPLPCLCGWLEFPAVGILFSRGQKEPPSLSRLSPSAWVSSFWPLASLPHPKFPSVHTWVVSAIFSIAFQKFPATDCPYKDARLDPQTSHIPVPCQLSVLPTARNGARDCVAHSPWWPPGAGTSCSSRRLFLPCLSPPAPASSCVVCPLLVQPPWHVPVFTSVKPFLIFQQAWLSTSPLAQLSCWNAIVTFAGKFHLPFSKCNPRSSSRASLLYPIPTLSPLRWNLPFSLGPYNSIPLFTTTVPFARSISGFVYTSGLGCNT